MQVKSISPSETIVSGYAAVFGVIDLHRDIIMQGALQFKEGEVKFLWQHDHHNPIGIIHSLKEDNYGLYIKASINNLLNIGRETSILLKQGALNSFSIGFVVKDTNYNLSGVREILKANLYEVSIVTFPANEKAKVSSIALNLN